MRLEEVSWPPCPTRALTSGCRCKHSPCSSAHRHQPQLIHLTRGCFQNLWCCLIAVNVGVVITPNWRQATALAHKSLASPWMPSMPVLSSCGAWAGTQTLSHVWKSHFSSPAVAEDKSSVYLSVECSHMYMHSCLQTSCQCALMCPTDISTHGKTEHVSLQLWPPWGYSKLRAKFIPGMRLPPSLKEPPSHTCVREQESVKYSNKNGLWLWLIAFKLSLLAGQDRIK